MQSQQILMVVSCKPSVLTMGVNPNSNLNEKAVFFSKSLLSLRSFSSCITGGVMAMNVI